MLNFAADLVDLLTGLQRFMMLEASSLPEFTRDALLEAAGHPSPVDRIVDSAEALFAVKGQLGKEGRDTAARLAQFAAVNGWHGMGDRGLQMARALQRIGGYAAPEGTEWPSADEDPAPLDKFLPPEERAVQPSPAPIEPDSAAPVAP